MRKVLFLSYKPDMDLGSLVDCGANELIVPLNALSKGRWDSLRSLNMRVGIYVAGTSGQTCPLDPVERRRLRDDFEEALSYQPDAIWADHMRFDGYWEGLQGGVIPNTHRECQWCRGVNRVGVINEIAEFMKQQAAGNCELGYFAVPFKPVDVSSLVTDLSQDHKTLAKHFDFVSPMLYHRMIGKPASYISEYVSWLAGETGKPIVPIIQVKDMPGEDTLSVNEMRRAFAEATKLPSAGVAWFTWEAALEQSKTDIIRSLFEL